MTNRKTNTPGVDRTRRSLVRKAVYTAPALIGFGLLSRATPAAERPERESSRAQADCNPISDPDCKPPSGPNTFLEEPGLNLDSDKEEWV